jgi:hypothetical protein
MYIEGCLRVAIEFRCGLQLNIEKAIEGFTIFSSQAFSGTMGYCGASPVIWQSLCNKASFYFQKIEAFAGPW